MTGGDDGAAGGQPVVEALPKPEASGEPEDGEKRPERRQAGGDEHHCVDAFDGGESTDSPGVQAGRGPDGVEAKPFHHAGVAERDRLKQSQEVQPFQRTDRPATEAAPAIVEHEDAVKTKHVGVSGKSV